MPAIIGVSVLAIRCLFAEGDKHCQKRYVAAPHVGDMVAVRRSAYEESA